MRSASDDFTARAAIRDRALELFAQHGPDATTVRSVAAAAGVSPALVLHHWRSKEGLKAGVDEHVSAVMVDVLELVVADLRQLEVAAGAPGAVPTAGSPSLAHEVLDRLPASSAVPAYLRRLLLGGDPAGVELLRKWHQTAMDLLTAMAADGVIRPGRRLHVRAAVLMVSDLAVLLLREPLRDLLGEDPLAEPGLTHWSEELRDLYEHGLTNSKEH